MGKQDPNRLSLPRLLAHLLPPAALNSLVRVALAEDLGARGDITTSAFLTAPRVAKASIVARQRATVCGGPVVAAVMAQVDKRLRVKTIVADGGIVRKGGVVATVQGDLASIVAAERTALNFLGMLSGIATGTSAFVSAVAGTGATIVDTRKTVPGLRLLSKYAVRCGGAHLHRLGLHDAFLSKDNHAAGLSAVDYAATVGKAAARARRRGARFVEAEADSPKQVEALLRLPRGELDIILLDNMSLSQLRTAVRMRGALRSNVLLEASGGVALATVGRIARTGVDRIAVGAITHSAPWVDFGLDIS